MATVVPTSFQFGIPTEEERQWPIIGWPRNTTKWRIRFRSDDVATIICKTSTGIRRYILERGEGQWIINPEWEQGENRTA